MRTLYWFAVIKVARGLGHIHPPAANWFGEKTGLVAALERIIRGA
jgi:hypothetical protein